MFKFKVTTFYDTKEEVFHGYVPGTTFNEAFQNLMKNFGEEETFKISLTYLNDSNIIIGPKEIIKYLEKENNV